MAGRQQDLGAPGRQAILGPLALTLRAQIEHGAQTQLFEGLQVRAVEPMKGVRAEQLSPAHGSTRRKSSDG